MAVNHLLLTDAAEEEKADDMLEALTNIAYKTPQLQAATKVKKKKKKQRSSEGERKSRFFYKPTTSFSSDIETRKRQSVAAPETALTVLDKEVEDRRSEYSKELPLALQENIAAVREFFLQELGPLYLAAQAGTTQASQVMQRTLNTEIDNQAFIQFERMISKASTIKMARFIASYLDLPVRTVEALLQTVQPAQPREIMMVNNNPFDDRRPPKVKEKPEGSEE